MKYCYNQDIDGVITMIPITIMFVSLIISYPKQIWAVRSLQLAQVLHL